MVAVQHELRFSTRFRYGEAGIAIPVRLSLGRQSLRSVARLDTGSDVSIFQREHGEALRLEIESGQPLQIFTVNGSFLTYGHTVTLEALGIELDATVYFSFAYGFPRNVLGRRGWIEQLQLGLIHYDRLLYAARYDAGARG
jgi:hypothetical protein